MNTYTRKTASTNAPPHTRVYVHERKLFHTARGSLTRAHTSSQADNWIIPARLECNKYNLNGRLTLDCTYYITYILASRVTLTEWHVCHRVTVAKRHVWHTMYTVLACVRIYAVCTCSEQCSGMNYCEQSCSIGRSTYTRREHNRANKPQRVTHIHRGTSS
jgi:hypothetical protein